MAELLKSVGRLDCAEAALIPSLSALPSEVTTVLMRPGLIKSKIHYSIFSVLLLVSVACSSALAPTLQTPAAPELRLVHNNIPTPEKTLIVLIHGWGGDNRETWLNFPSLLFERLSETFDVASFGYPSGLNPQSPPLQWLADYLSQWLNRKTGEGNNADYCQYIFLTHSFGGLVAKQLVVSELSLGRRLKTHLVFLIGTPNLGDDISRLANYIPFIPKDQLRQLQDDAFLAFLHQRYMIHTGLLRKEGVHPAVVQPIRTIAILGKNDRDSDGVVNVISAQAFFPDSRIVFKHHVDLVKPANSADQVFTIVRDDVERATDAGGCGSPPTAARRGNFLQIRTAQLTQEEAPQMRPIRKQIFLVPGAAASATFWDNFTNVAKEDPRLAGSDVVRFTHPTGWFSSPDIKTIASDLAKKIVAKSDVETHLICHGVGAVICQDAVLQTLRSGHSQALNLGRIVLLSPPTSSWDLGIFGELPKQAVTKVPGADLSYLANLQKEWFLRVKDGGDPLVPSAFKKGIKVLAVFGSEDHVVTKGVSDRLFDKVAIVPGTHVGVAQPSSRQDLTYQLVTGEIFKETR